VLSALFSKLKILYCPYGKSWGSYSGESWRSNTGHCQCPYEIRVEDHTQDKLRLLLQNCSSVKIPCNYTLSVDKYF